MVFDDKRDVILSRLRIEDIVRHYADVRLNGKSRCPCPLHGGRNNNFTVYTKTNSFYCFTCGEGGDLIKFVSIYFSITYGEAIRKLDGDFRLGLFEKPHKSLNALLKEQAKRRREQQQREALAQWRRFNYDLLIRYFKWLKRQTHTKAIKHDTEHIERLLDMHLNIEENPLTLEAKPLIRALYSKHRKEVLQCQKK